MTIQKLIQVLVISLLAKVLCSASEKTVALELSAGWPRTIEQHPPKVVEVVEVAAQ